MANTKFDEWWAAQCEALGFSGYASPKDYARMAWEAANHARDVGAVETTIFWDWKTCPELDDLQNALQPLGVYVYPHPVCNGHDMYGFIFSGVELSDAELARWDHER